ncbi:hypothetical protein D1Y84_04070 [Acidipila sp. EB88]|nr:hypothetical protein D1Y84_04070 [Acidipila sp. EB88]
MFPALFLFALLDLLASIWFGNVDPVASRLLFVRTYTAYDLASFSLQMWLLYEIARAVLRPAGVWHREAFKALSMAAVAGASLAAGATLLMQPNNVHGPAALELRAEMFASLLACEIVVAMMLSAKEVGLPWRSHVMAVGQGFMAWSLVLASLEGLSAYLGPTHPYYKALYYVRSLNYLVTLGYWTVSLWRKEPARQPISPTLRKYVVALHEKVQYDLGKVGH